MMGFQNVTGVTYVPLPVLTARESADLIRAVARRAASDQDDQAIAGIAEFCDYLPQAMTLVVTRLAVRPDISFADRLAELKSRPKRLPAIDEHLGGQTGGVARAFGRGRRALPRVGQPAR